MKVKRCRKKWKKANESKMNRSEKKTLTNKMKIGEFFRVCIISEE